MWFEEKEIKHYQNILEIPDWESMLPTADYDVVAIKIMPVNEWNTFSFNYFETLIFLRYRLYNDKIEVNIYIKGEDMESEEEFLDCRCSLWILNLEELKYETTSPDFTEKYVMTKDYQASFSKTYEEDMCLGFYNGF